MEIRNIAIIAHVDHGKTTLTDALMKQNGGLQDEGVSMDSNALEKERGITIYSKNTSIYYKGTKINIVDTPGHADFGSEVERILRAIDSVLLLVDAAEGPMPQTRFVLKKSLELGLKPIVVINKIDRPSADFDRIKTTLAEVLELFFELGANEEQANFETVYAIGREGLAFRNLPDQKNSPALPASGLRHGSNFSDPSGLSLLLDVILEKVLPASGGADKKMSAQVFNLAYDNFLGRMAIARIYSGKISSGSQIFIKGENGTRKGKITKLFSFEGIKRIEVNSADSGDIVLLAGIPDIYIGETLCEDENVKPLPQIAIDEPTLSLNFLVNDSPFAGREGKFVTGRQLKERLKKELEVNVGLKVDFSSSFFKVYGRGELHIAILLENMRREGFEMQVSQPEVILKENDGELVEPYEELVIDVPMIYSGQVVEKISQRRGLMKNMVEKEGIARIIFDIPTRGFLGYGGEFIIDTKGKGVMSSRVTGFGEYAGEIKKRDYGSMVSMTSGKAVAFSLANLQERGILYIEHGTEVYKGMVIGNVLKGDDLSVNPTKGKQLTNMRASGTDEAITLNPVFVLNIERGLEVMNRDDYLEITPKSVRLRKKEKN